MTLRVFSNTYDSMILDVLTLILCIQAHERGCEQSLDILLAPWLYSLLTTTWINNLQYILKIGDKRWKLAEALNFCKQRRIFTGWWFLFEIIRLPIILMGFSQLHAC